MNIHYQDDRVTLYAGNCLDVMKGLDDQSVDAIVTDPPYELGFMGKSWDASGIAFNVDVWREPLRVLKPGGHLLAFSGSRTYHRMAVAIEDAGFEIRDQIQWIYGSGFPKSMDVSKQIDKAAGSQREVVSGVTDRREDGTTYGLGHSGIITSKDAITDDAKTWQGWGTALKPAHEPIVLARKPLIGTVANNVLTHGTGALNIDGTRVGDEGRVNTPAHNVDGSGWGMRPNIEPSQVIGRWPANVIHDGSDEALHYFGEPARFFYCAKTSKRDRNEGLEDFEAVDSAEMVDRVAGSAGMNSPRAGAGRTSGAKNHHPTVKPTELMRYLVRMITPPQGVVLDPFLGSGSTGKAAMYEGNRFIGIELTEEYLPIALARIQFAKNEPLEEQLFPADFARPEIQVDDER